MADSVNPRTAHPLRPAIEMLELNKTEISRRYGCSTNFVHNCLAGKYPTPERLEELLQTMIEERATHLRTVLDDLDNFPWFAQSAYDEVGAGKQR